ncbi:MAG: flagellar motor protein MotD [Gammaproteobacteria bacterium]|nr:flagellar motor protein MotD [Gammaproteobacteria bacterium]
MSRRKKTEEESEHHDRWLISYADFITLLFAFFVMMYSISSVNEGKYRVLADSIVSAFQNINDEAGPQSQPVASKTPIQIGKTPKMLAPVPDKVADLSANEKNNREKLNKLGHSPEVVKRNLTKNLKTWVQKGEIKIRSSNRWIDVEISTGVLFRSGSSALSSKAVELLEPLSYQLLGYDKPVYVLGYSDNIPIHTNKYSSNWELSAARAVSVVNLFAGLGIDPETLGAIGFGEHRPVANNDSAQGRNKNRRVIVRIFTSNDIFSET